MGKNWAIIDELKSQANLAEREGDLELAEQLWNRILAVSPGDLDAIAAIERIDKVAIEQSPLQIDEPSNKFDISPFQKKIIWIALILLGLSVASLIFSYEIFYSQPWHDEYSLDHLSGWIIESLRSFILLVGLCFIIGVSFEKETQEVFGICELKKEYVLPAKIARYILLFIASISTIRILHYHINIAPQELANITNNPTDILDNNKFFIKYQLPYITSLPYSLVNFIIVGGSINLTVFYSALKDIVNFNSLKKSFNGSIKQSTNCSEIESHFQYLSKSFKAIISRYINLVITLILILLFELLIGKHTLSSVALKLTNLAYNLYMIEICILLILSYYYHKIAYKQSEKLLKSIKCDVSQFKKEYNTLNLLWNIIIDNLPVCISIFLIIAILSITILS